MKGSPPNLCHIKYILGNLNSTNTPQKSCFRIRMEGKPIEKGKISQKDLAIGKPTRGIRKREDL